MPRRSRWSEDEWRALLAAQGQSGLSVRAFAAGAGVAYTTLVYWKQRLRESRPRLVPVEIEHGGDAHIDVIVGGVVVRVAADFDDGLLVRVVRALRAC